jgi:hypothetical protein
MISQTLTALEVQNRLSAARETILTRTHRAHNRKVGLRVGLGAVAFIAVGSSIAATAAFWTASGEQARTTVACYQHDDVNSVSSTTGGLKTHAASSETPTLDPQASCSTAWRAGLGLVAGPHGAWPQIDPAVSNLAVPPLAFCVLNDGITAGFPIEKPYSTAGQVCSGLDLAQWRG